MSLEMGNTRKKAYKTVAWMSRHRRSRIFSLSFQGITTTMLSAVTNSNWCWNQRVLSKYLWMKTQHLERQREADPPDTVWWLQVSGNFGSCSFILVTNNWRTSCTKITMVQIVNSGISATGCGTQSPTLTRSDRIHEKSSYGTTWKP